jgi:hypothetical protein
MDNCRSENEKIDVEESLQGEEENLVDMLVRSLLFTSTVDLVGTGDQ